MQVFYADYALQVSQYPESLQISLNFVIKLFQQIGLVAKDDDVLNEINNIGDYGRGVWPVKYMEGSNLPGAAEGESAVLGLQSGDDGVIHDR